MSDPVTQAPVAPIDPVDPPTPQEPNTIAYSKYRELLDEKKKVAAKAAEYEAKEKAAHEAKLKSQGDYESLIKARESELEASKAENARYKAQMAEAKKLSAFMRAAGEVESKWLGMVDTSAITFKADSDEIDEFSVKNTVETFKKEWPEAYKPKGVSLPPAGMPNGQAFITEEEWKKLPVKEMKKYKPDQIKG